MKFSYLFAAVALLFGTSNASAVTTTYDFTAGGTPVGVAVGCSAGGLLNTGLCDVTYSSAGAGVRGVPDTDPGNIDSFPIASFETLWVTFLNPTFKLQSFTLGRFGQGDDYEYSLDGTSFTGVKTDNPATVSLTGLSATILGIRASSFRLGDLFAPDSFTLASITGDVTVAAVPLPAGVMLLGSGLGALGFFGWRKKRASGGSLAAA